MYEDQVWIELRDRSEKENEAAAEKVSKMLHKLGWPAYSEVWWNERKGVYCLTINDAGEFVELNDRGHWFPLDRLAA